LAEEMNILKKKKKKAKSGDVVIASFGDSEALLAKFCIKRNITLLGIGRAFDFIFKDTLQHQKWLKKDPVTHQKQIIAWRNQNM
jgi:hypothetical protein